MITKYSFSKLCDSERLRYEINTSSIVTALEKIETKSTPATTDVYFKDSLSTEDDTTLSALVTSHVAVPLPDMEIKTVKLDEVKTSSGIPKVSVYEPEGPSATICSHNFADKCSWYQGAVQVTGGSLTSSDGFNFLSALNKTHWIDLEHGRVYDEDNIMAAAANTYKVKVYVDGVLKAETTDYTLDYVLGKVTFLTAQTGVVTANYWYADKSWYRIGPKSGKILSIKAAEVQFSKGTTLSSPFIFEPWFVDHPTYGTVALSALGIPGQQIVYKNAKDFISACNEGQGLIPAWGELTLDVHVFPFNYARPKPLKFSDHVEIRVFCKNHEPCGGEYATATFYVTIDNETP